MPDLKLPGGKKEIPIWIVGLIVAAGLGYIVYKNMQGSTAAGTAAQPTTAGVDSAILAQNFDSLRQQLYDMVNSEMGVVTQTQNNPPTPNPGIQGSVIYNPVVVNQPIPGDLGDPNNTLDQPRNAPAQRLK